VYWCDTLETGEEVTERSEKSVGGKCLLRKYLPLWSGVENQLLIYLPSVALGTVE